ncbi:MAG: cation transporter [candidate division Zixibacteria bacterium]|nr:cation transporter [candidate division Zixibacteria bacterium]MCI0596006.1 cation transporter [candidate division Zixibacteria bacterium]
MRTGWIKGGSILSGLVASACCIGPLIFSLLGLGSFGLAAALEKWRPLLMTVTFGFLGLAFYLTYRKKVVHCADGTCEVKTAGKAQKMTLWTVAALAVALALYPQWGPALGIGVTKAPVIQATQASQTVELGVSGMTCEGCAQNVKSALVSVPGVADAEVSWEEGKAVVKVSNSVEKSQLKVAVEKSGYKVVSEPKKTN